LLVALLQISPFMQTPQLTWSPHESFTTPHSAPAAAQMPAAPGMVQRWFAVLQTRPSPHEPQST
jgi:hypothetical protein